MAIRMVTGCWQWQLAICSAFTTTTHSCHSLSTYCTICHLYIGIHCTHTHTHTHTHTDEFVSKISWLL